MKALALLCAAVLLAACGGAGRTRTVSLASIAANPEQFDGERVTVEAGYYGAFEVSVLTSGFAESFPPQPIEPLIWVGAGPPVRCLQEAEGGVRWAERLTASGVFRYEPDGGFGHLGAYEMALGDASLSC